MIRKFFQRLNQIGVKYMLISGQATVLYGAATFSEDIDIWIMPEENNWKKFIEVLRELGAKVYKLTPPFKLEFIQKGHGFHFEFPKSFKEPIWFLDALGILPRVGSFQKVCKNIKFFKTDWGIIPVMGLRDLVEIKKTRRLEDYPIISNLVKNQYDEYKQKNRIKNGDWEWILKNSYEAEDIFFYIRRHKKAQRICEILPRRCLRYCLEAIRDHSKFKKAFFLLSKEISLEIEELRDRDRKYWSKIIAELKDLNSRGKLLKVGDIPKW